MSTSPTMSTLPSTTALPDTSKFSPTNRLNPIPAPPPTVKVPVPELEALVVSNSAKLPASKPDLVPENASELLVAA